MTGLECFATGASQPSLDRGPVRRATRHRRLRASMRQVGRHGCVATRTPRGSHHACADQARPLRAPRVITPFAQMRWPGSDGRSARGGHRYAIPLRLHHSGVCSGKQQWGHCGGLRGHGRRRPARREVSSGSWSRPSVAPNSAPHGSLWWHRAGVASSAGALGDGTGAILGFVVGFTYSAIETITN